MFSIESRNRQTPHSAIPDVEMWPRKAALFDEKNDEFPETLAAQNEQISTTLQAVFNAVKYRLR